MASICVVFWLVSGISINCMQRERGGGVSVVASSRPRAKREGFRAWL